MSPRFKFWPNAAAVFACFFLLRFLVLWAGVEQVSHNDELDLGTMAKEILRGLNFPYRDYQLDFYSGESLVLGAAAVPFFKLFGTNLLALKMVPLFFSASLLAVSWIFLHRHFGEKAGKMGAWLLVLCPASFVQLSLVGMTGHSEALLWSAGSLWMFYEFLYGQPERRLKCLAAFGLLSGFGCWFFYANLVLTSACLLAWLVMDRRSLFSAKALLFAAAFCAGLAPWLLCHTDWVPGFFATLPAGGTSGRVQGFFIKEAKLFLMGLPHAFAFYGAAGVPARVWSFGLWALFFMPSLLWSLKNMKDRKVLPLALYAAVFFIVFGLVHFDLQKNFGFVGYRYLTPLIYVSLLAFAVMASRLKRGNLLWAAVLGLGLFSQSGLLAGPAGRAPHYKGYSYYQLGVRQEFSNPELVKKKQDLQHFTTGFSKEERDLFLWGFSDAALMEGRADLAAFVPPRPPFPSPAIEKGKTAYIKWQQGTPEEIAGEDASWAWRGAGYLFFMWDGYYPKRLVPEMLNSGFMKFAGGHHPDLYWGMGWAIRESMREDARRSKDWALLFPAEAKPYVLEGMEYYENFYGQPGL